MAFGAEPPIAPGRTGKILNPTGREEYSINLRRHVTRRNERLIGPQLHCNLPVLAQDEIDSDEIRVLRGEIVPLALVGQRFLQGRLKVVVRSSSAGRMD